MARPTGATDDNTAYIGDGVYLTDNEYDFILWTDRGVFDTNPRGIHWLALDAQMIDMVKVAAQGLIERRNNNDQNN